MTYDQLLELCKTGDVLINPYRPEGATVTEEGLIILGYNGDGDGYGYYASDLRLVIEPNGIRAWMRDPEGTSEEDVFHGPTWTAEAFFEDYESLVSWAYSW